MRYVHFAEMCATCDNKRNLRRSHIRIKLTCLILHHSSITARLYLFATRAGVLYMKNMIMQHWEEADEAKPADPAEFVIHENDKQVVRDHIVEAVIATSSPIRYAVCCQRQ